jgi:hypothetical protein
MKFWVMPGIVQTPPDTSPPPDPPHCRAHRLPFVRESAAHYLLHVALEPHRADLLRLWADALDANDLTAAEREEATPTIWRARAIAEDPSAYDDSDFFALVKDFERAYGRWRKASEPDPPGPTAAGPKA